MRWAAASWCRREVRDSIHRYMIPGGYALYAYANGGDDVFTGKTDQRKRSSTGINEFQTLCGVFFFFIFRFVPLCHPSSSKSRRKEERRPLKARVIVELTIFPSPPNIACNTHTFLLCLSLHLIPILSKQER
jgi:hypothetical protein